MSIIRNRGIRIILFGLLFIIATIICSYSFKNYNKDCNITNRIQKDVAKKIDEVSSAISELDSIYMNGDFNTVSEKIYELYNRDGFAFAIIKDNSIELWTKPIILDVFDSINHWKSMTIRYNDGYYISRHIDKDGYSIVGLALINDVYDSNTAHTGRVQKSLLYDNNISVVDYITSNAITDNDGNFLFSIIVNRSYHYNTIQGFILFILYVIGFFLIAYGIWCYILSIYFDRVNKFLLFGYFIIFVALVRYILSIINVPPALYESPLFSDHIYVPMVFGRSFGDFIINTFSLFFMSYLLYDNVLKYRNFKPFKLSLQIFTIAFFFVFFFAISILYVFFINDFLERSDISFKLTDFQNIDYMAFVGIYVIMAISGSYFYLVLVFAYYSINVIKNININLAAMCYFPLSIPLFFLFPLATFIHYYVFFTIFFLSIHFIHLKRNRVDSISLLIFYILLFGALTSYILSEDSFHKETATRKEMIKDLAFGRVGSFTEAVFEKERDNIINDNLLESILKRYAISTCKDNIIMEEVIDYINRAHFKELRGKCNIQTTVCFSEDRLSLNDNSVVNCGEYFSNLINDYGVDTDVPNLYLLEFSPNDISYFGVINIYIPDIKKLCSIYVEMFPKPISEIKEYDNLIINRTLFATGKLNEYSFARYFFGELSYKIGDYEYDYILNKEYNTDSLYTFFDSNGYSHLMFRVDKDEYLILSAELPNLTSILAPFSYISLCYFFGVIVISLFILILSDRKVKIFKSYSSNIQIVLVLIILISFLVISIFSVYSMIKIDDRKEIDVVTEKAFSIQNSINSLIQTDGVSVLNKHDKMKLVISRLSHSLLIDINIYALNGKLLVSSANDKSPNNGMNEYIDPIAYGNLRNNNSIVYVQKEDKEGYRFNSIYVSVIDRDYGVVAYINVPYFIRHKESFSSLFSFIVTTINLYIVLIMVSLIIVYIVSRAITQPLRLLSDKLIKFNLFKHNEKIEWRANDEIGLLINEYNRVVDELTISANQLASSERENAWKEMARQIAHEVKNPLTPMKLSIQHLQRAWQKKDPDFENRLNRFTATMIEQIDTLSAISTSFSNYSTLEHVNLEKTNIIDLLNNTILLFKDANAIFAYTFFANKSYVVEIDRTQMTQVFNNLISNAIQAVSDKEDGLITFDAMEENGYVLLSISDNGCGMSEETKRNIFKPYFTTKNSGTGLGLSIVKNIINSNGGEIYFKSEQNVGTVFYVKLKLITD